MTRNFILTVFLLFLGPLFGFAQGIDVSYVSIINLGDGRLYHTKVPEGTPLEGTQRIIDGRKSEYREVNFSEGLMNGAYVYYRNNKLVEEGHYTAGVKDGSFREYFSDGQTVKRSRDYKNGKLEGADITYYTNGQPEREKWYRQSVEHGPERRWEHETGELISEMHYQEGKLHGPYMKRMRSNVSDYIIRGTYETGILEGEYTETYTDGQLRAKGLYSKGKPVGEWQQYERSLNDKGKIHTRKVKP